jgi:hypothetical protein
MVYDATPLESLLHDANANSKPPININPIIMSNNNFP